MPDVPGRDRGDGRRRKHDSHLDRSALGPKNAINAERAFREQLVQDTQLRRELPEERIGRQLALEFSLGEVVRNTNDIIEEIDNAKQPSQRTLDRAKIVAAATRKAARTLERLSDDNLLWEAFQEQQYKLVLRDLRLPVTTDMLVELGCDTDEAQHLVEVAQQMLWSLIRGPQSGEAHYKLPVEVGREAIRELAGLTKELANQADQGILYRQGRDDFVHGLERVLIGIVSVLVNIIMSFALSQGTPTWAEPILHSIDSLRQVADEATLSLLTFAAAEQGARITAELVPMGTYAPARLATWIWPDWRPFSGAHPQLVQRFKEVCATLETLDAGPAGQYTGRATSSEGRASMPTPGISARPPGRKDITPAPQSPGVAPENDSATGSGFSTWGFPEKKRPTFRGNKTDSPGKANRPRRPGSSPPAS
jgi:hypothetical protein